MGIRREEFRTYKLLAKELTAYHAALATPFLSNHTLSFSEMANHRSVAVPLNTGAEFSHLFY